VAAYLRRGRIVPPPICDRCGQRATVSPYHPDPAQRRVLLWLCEADRRAVPAAGFSVVTHWTWPGHIEPLPTAPRWPRFHASTARIDGATDAIAPYDAVTPAHRREMFAAAFFRGSDAGERRALFGAGLAALRAHAIATWSPYGDARADDPLRLWIAEEHRRWERARITTAPRFEIDDDRIAERAVKPRFFARVRRRAGRAIDAIGSVPAPPPHRTKPLAPAAPVAPADDALLERVDAELAAFDRRLEEILARVPPAATVRNGTSAEEDD
jgi:hypothetical protein